jgi:hypothetical protein
MGKFKILIILAVCVVVILVVGLAVVVVYSSSAEHRRSRTFNDSDLIPARVEVPVESNAFWTLSKATNELYWPERLSHRLDDLSKNTNWDDSLAADVLEKNRRCLNLFDEAMQQPFLIVPQPKTFDEEYSYLGGWKAITRVECISLFVSFRKGNETEAFDSAFKIIEHGQKAENSGGTILHYLVGSAIKSIGLGCLQQMIPQTTLPETNLVEMIDRLNDFKANPEGLTNALKVEYQMERRFLDDLAAGKYPTTNSESIQMAFPLGIRLFFSPTRTKMKFAQADRVLRDNISKPYSEIPWADLPLVATNASTWQRLLSGNAIGDTLFELLEPSSEAFVARKCRENVEVTATQLLLALKAYKMRHGRLPESLSGLVPEYFPHVPPDDFDGRPFCYLPPQKRIYSVGPDLKDSGGQARRQYSESYDLPFRIEF